MAIIPLKQSITLTRTESSGGWGGGASATFKLDARVDELTKEVQNSAGEETVTSAEITLDGLADVLYSDVITYEDELERKLERSPIRIEPVRGPGGKAWLTTVYV